MVDQLEIEANGVRFAYLTCGDGPLLLLLHGYPDNARTWSRQFESFAAAGFRVVAPWLRGYPPTEIPTSGYYDRATLAADIRALIEALGPDEPAFLVGQDWGAAISYGVLGAFPELIARAVILAVPHPVQIRRTLRTSPRHAIRSFHWFLFQLPWLPERLVRAFDYSFLETLWRLWSPEFHDREHVAGIREMMAEPGANEATLAYYRAMFRKSRQDPALAGLRDRLDDPIGVPTRVLCGSRDMRKEMLARQAYLFGADYDWQVVPDCGHFLHREQPDRVNALILQWLRPQSMA